MYSYEKLIEAATKRGGRLLSTNIKGYKKLQWQCSEGHIFWLTGHKVHRRGKWCSQCGTKGERELRKFFQQHNLSFIFQPVIHALPKRKYDFYFQYNGRAYLVEFDGEQHFRYVRKYHRVAGKFAEAQLIDRIKTLAAWKTGYHLIRIDYSQMENVAYHLINALNQNLPVYLSSPDLYKYLYKEVPMAELQKHLPSLFP